MNKLYNLYACIGLHVHILFTVLFNNMAMHGLIVLL